MGAAPRIRVEGAFGWERPLFRVEGLVMEPPGLHCVLGPNGAGKSTFLKTLAGSHELLEGSIVMEPREVGRVYSPPLPPVGVGLDGWSLLQVLTESPSPLVSSRLPPRVRLALEYLQQLGAPRGGLGRSLSSMSTGEAVKVMLSGILASGAEALFLDEPNGHLDMASRTRLYRLLSREAQNRLVVASLHDVAEASQVCRKVVLIGGEGSVVWGEAREVLVPGVAEKAYGVEFAEVSVMGRRVLLPLLRGERID